MRYFFDTEFIDTGREIDLVSIAIVAGDGRELYLQSCEFNPKMASPWVCEQVFPHLDLCPRIHVRGKPSVLTDLAVHEQGQCSWASTEGTCGYEPGCLWRTRKQIMYAVAEFCYLEQYGTPEFWGWCAGYDFVALCQLFGTMMDLPVGWPHYIRDLQYLLDARGLTDDMLPQQTEQVHNALADARYLKELWTWLAPRATPPHWLSDKEMRDRLLREKWSEEKHPLLLTGYVGGQYDFMGVWHNGELIPKGDPRLDEQGNVRTHPDEMTGGYVGHEPLATTGGDSGPEPVFSDLPPDKESEA